MRKKAEEVEPERWINHYSSLHQILMVGEGDFSFALCLARSFQSAFNIVATSLDSYDSLIKHYKSARSNLRELERFGASLLHGVDATKMKLHPDLSIRKFDRIIYNFPHSGFHGKEDEGSIIRLHQKLVQGFFCNAAHMLRANGEIHISHKTSRPFDRWNLEELAILCSLKLIGRVDFNIEDYPGYNNKRGAGSRCDDPFPLGESSTFKFAFFPGANEQRRSKESPCYYTLQPAPILCNESIHHAVIHQQNQPSMHPRGGVLYSQTGISNPYITSRKEMVFWVFDAYFKHVKDTYGKPEPKIAYNVQCGLRQGYDRYVSFYGAGNAGGFIDLLENLYKLSLERRRWLEGHLLSNNF